MSIKITSLTKIYGQQKAVNNISFDVQKGEITGFLGPNGAGKSTTMKMITGYIEPDSGSMEVCGIKVQTGSIETQKKIGYLPETNPLYVDMYVREFLQFAANIHAVPKAKQRIEEVINMVGLTPESNKKISQLSKGYKQRTGLAAALVHDPEVLILDEPTSGLDPNQLMEIREMIKRLGENKTVLFSSHIMQEVEAVCDRVIIINKGKIVANNSIENLRNESLEGQTIHISFNRPVPSSLLESIRGIETVQAQNAQTFLITCKDADSIKKELLAMSLKEGLDISSLQTGSKSLETVFKSLTT
ncbi:MAG: gliding motility-associated ABC transporter ATP-binding subunit GldA [Chitinophagaceae bacterium]|nr:gliding motility-associated ABC transporter ATP-binding subunit GldA [Bacteroidota bacterium]MCC6257429.1 gliding motility-associated ABC transporter ATP-binding subunit GldA [Chitinophagaceae bacterium]